MPTRASPVSALAALYQGEKTDAAYIFNTAMAMMGAAVVYLVGAIPFLGTLSNGPAAKLSLCLVPAPLWLVVAFHSLITLNAMMHGVSVRIIEDALFEATGLRVIPVQRTLVGSAAGDKIMDINLATPIHRLTTRVVYGGIFVLVLGFTVFVLYSAAKVGRNDVVLTHVPLLVWIAAGVYLSVGFIVARSWKVGLKMVAESRAECAKYEQYWQKRGVMPRQDIGTDIGGLENYFESRLDAVDGDLKVIREDIEDFRKGAAGNAVDFKELRHRLERLEKKVD
jgi:hypothetical protein